MPARGRRAGDALKPAWRRVEEPPAVIEPLRGGRVDDRRKYPRIATDQVISFSLLDARDQLGVSKNLSAGGIRFEAVGCELDLGDTIRVTFNLGEQTVVAVGQVTWATEVDPLTTDIGLVFLEVDPEALRLLEDFEESSFGRRD